MDNISSAISIFINFKVNLYVLVISFPLSYVIGLTVASLIFISSERMASILCAASYLIRSTPLVVLLVVLYFFFSPFNFNLSPESIAVLVFSIYYGAIFTEKFRSSFISVGRVVFEVGFTLGINRYVVLKEIFFPQILIQSFPAASNAIQGIIKDTAILSAISIMDAITTAKSIASITFNFMWPFLVMYFCFSITYVSFTLLLNIVQKHLDRRFGRSL